MPFQSKVANVEKKEIARIEMSPEFPVSPVDYNVRSETPPIPPHIHDCLELGWCHRGSGVFLVDNKILKFKQGDAVFINSREVHIMYSTPGGETAWSFINLNQEELLSAFVTGQERWSDVSGYCGPGFHNIIDGECHPELTRVIREIIECRNREESGYRSEVRALVWLLLIRLRRWMPAPGATAAPEGIMLRLVPALEHIARHIDAPIRIPHLAKLCSTSESNFRKLFHAGVGTSPKEYLQNMRMKFAAVKLAHSAMPIIEIAAKCGFASFSNFNRQFLRHHGVSPSHYRRTHGANLQIREGDGIFPA